MAGGTTRYHRHTCKFKEPASRTRTHCGCTPRLALRSTTTKPELPELRRGHACEPAQKTKQRRAELCAKCGNASAGPPNNANRRFLLICHSLRDTGWVLPSSAPSAGSGTPVRQISFPLADHHIAVAIALSAHSGQLVMLHNIHTYLLEHTCMHTYRHTICMYAHCTYISNAHLRPPDLSKRPNHHVMQT